MPPPPPSRALPGRVASLLAPHKPGHAGRIVGQHSSHEGCKQPGRAEDVPPQSRRPHNCAPTPGAIRHADMACTGVGMGPRRGQDGAHLRWRECRRRPACARPPESGGSSRLCRSTPGTRAGAAGLPATAVQRVPGLHHACACICGGIRPACSPAWGQSGSWAEAMPWIGMVRSGGMGSCRP